MERDKRAVPGQSEGKDQGGDVPTGEMAGDEGLKPDDASAEENAGHGDAMAESDESEDLEEPSAEESDGVAVVGGGVHGDGDKNEDNAVPKNTAATRFMFQAAISHPTLPISYRRMPVRSRKQSKPTRFIAEGTASSAAQSAGVVSALSAADQAAMNEAQGSTVVGSGKASNPNCGPSFSDGFPFSSDGTSSVESDATVDKPSTEGGKIGTDAANAPAARGARGASSSASYRPLSRGRKQRRPEQFIPEEAESSARAKTIRGNIALHRFITSLFPVLPGRRPEGARTLTADDVGGQGQGGVEGSEELDGRARVVAVVAVLGASLALCAVACVLFYAIGQRNEQGPSDENQK